MKWKAKRNETYRVGRLYKTCEEEEQDDVVVLVVQAEAGGSRVCNGGNSFEHLMCLRFAKAGA